MRVTLFMAMTVNGIVARKNGEEDFLSDQNWNSLIELASKFGNFVVGRKTYETVKGWDEDFSFDDLSDVKRIIVSKRQNFRPDEGYSVARSPEAAIAELQQGGFTDALVSGGTTLNTSFAKAGLLDEMIINVEPTILGEGLPLFSVDDFQSRLELLEINDSKDFLQLRYKFI